MRIGRSPWQAVALTSALAISGCEAPLILDHVEEQRGATTQRFDLFQATTANDNTIVVVGNAGVVLTSTDNGATWNRQQLSGAPFLLDVTTCPNNEFVALAAEREVWFADTGGSNWRSVAIDTYEYVQAIECDTNGGIWVVGSFSTIWRSDDGGASWSETSMDEDMNLTSIQFVDDAVGFVTGEFGDIFRTQDGGDTWEYMTPLPDEFYPQAAHFSDTQTGWIAGLNGTIWQTRDGGISWEQQPTDTVAPLYGIAANGTGLYAVGGFGTVLASDPSGGWNSIDHGKPIRFYLRGILSLDDHRILAVGGAGALHVIEV